MDGAALAARFSIATNRLQYCGPADAEPILYGAIVRNERLAEARTTLRGFEALLPYLELIGRHHGLDPFDGRVVEAYWIGNELLEGFHRREFVELFDAFRRRGMPASIARRLADHLPEMAVPHHTFHVAYVGVGTVTGHVPTTLANIESCRPAGREVLEVRGDQLRLRGAATTLEGGRLRLGKATEETHSYDPAVLPGLASGQWVVLHWGWPALALSDRQRGDLEAATEQSFRVANAAWPSLRTLS